MSSIPKFILPLLFVFSIFGCEPVEKMDSLENATGNRDIESIPTGEVNSGWKIPFHGSRSEPVFNDGTVYIGSFDGSVYAIDPKNGKQIWRYQTGIGLTSGPEIILAPGDKVEDLLGAALEATGKKGKGKREIVATPVIKDGTL